MPEKQNVEWKSKWKDEYLEWICGFANAQGGKLFIGCDDEGSVVGLPDAHKLPKKLRKAPCFSYGDIRRFLALI